MKMKKPVLLILGVAGVIGLTACQKASENPSQNFSNDQEDQPIIEAVSYEGGYNDSVYDESDLQIQKNDDGTYQIQIVIIRLAAMDDCVGHETENGLEFSVNDWDWGNGEISGIITLDGDIATVTFTAGWNESKNEYQYHKISDIPTLR